MNQIVLNVGLGACSLVDALIRSPVCPTQSQALVAGYVIFVLLALLGLWTLRKTGTQV